jgi:hypothetical protein
LRADFAKVAWLQRLKTLGVFNFCFFHYLIVLARFSIQKALITIPAETQMSGATSEISHINLKLMISKGRKNQSCGI